MKVQEVMTQEVLTIGPEVPVRDAAKILVDHRISGLPVCDVQRCVLGVISEGDILFKEYDPRPARRSRLMGWLFDGRPLKAAIKAGARTAGEAMTSPAITIAPYDSVAVAARVMSERGVNRLKAPARPSLRLIPPWPEKWPP